MARIVVIDDDAVIRHQARRILESRGHVVEVAEDGAAGMACILERPPDLVITDIFMPGQDGMETLFQLRKTCPRVKVIAMSAGDGRGVLNLLDDAEVLGALRTLPKPFTPAELMEAVDSVLKADLRG